MASFKQEVLGMYLDQCVARGQHTSLGDDIGHSKTRAKKGRPPPAARTPTRGKSSPRGERHQEKYKKTSSRRAEENYSTSQLDALIAKKTKQLESEKRSYKETGMNVAKQKIDSTSSYLDDLRTIRSERGTDS